MEENNEKTYGEFIEEERAFLATNREKVKELQETLPQQALELLRKLTAKIIMVNADSDPNRSHWALAQCRQIIAGWDGELGLVQKFEKTEKRVAKYDMEQARKG